MTHRSKLKNRAVLLLLTFVLAACSNTQLIYTLADEFIEDEVAFFLNLDDEEDEAFLDAQVEELVAWHRTVMLPRYANYIGGLADKLEANQYDRHDIAAALEGGRELIEATVTGLTPRAAKVLVRHMAPEDITSMERKLTERNDERREELSEPDEKRYEERLDRLTRNFERVFEDLYPDQVALLEVHARATLNDAQVRLNNRMMRQKVFLDFLKTNPSEGNLTGFLNQLLLRGHELVNPGYKAFTEASIARFQTLLVNMLAISSPDQRAQAVDNLRDYAKDFRDVAS